MSLSQWLILNKDTLESGLLSLVGRLSEVKFIPDKEHIVTCPLYRGCPNFIEFFMGGSFIPGHHLYVGTGDVLCNTVRHILILTEILA